MKKLTTTLKEAARLIKWLTSHGFSYREVLDCIFYVFGSDENSKRTA